jgi:exodeoxyribonuclease V alpha subunit
LATTLIGQVDRILFEDEGFFIAVLKSGEKISGTYYESSVQNIKSSAITLSESGTNTRSMVKLLNLNPSK